MRQLLARVVHATSASSRSSTGGPPSWPAAARPGPEGSLGKLLWTNGMTLNVRRRLAHPRRRPRRRHRRVGDVRLGRARARRARLPDRRRVRRGPAQHHRRARARPPAGAARRQGRGLQGRAALSVAESATPIKEVQMRDDETFHHRDRCAISGIGWTDFSRSSGRSELTLATAGLAGRDRRRRPDAAGHRRHRALRHGPRAAQRPRRRPRA